jgi:hypothetical protein
MGLQSSPNIIILIQHNLTAIFPDHARIQLPYESAKYGIVSPGDCPLHVSDALGSVKWIKEKGPAKPKWSSSIHGVDVFFDSTDDVHGDLYFLNISEPDALDIQWRKILSMRPIGLLLTRSDDNFFKRVGIYSGIYGSFSKSFLSLFTHPYQTEHVVI